MKDCIFCKIVRKEISATEVARTESAVAFADLNPKAPTHVLVVPNRHARNLGEFVLSAPPEELASLFALAARIGTEASPDGYRVVVNQGRDGGQTVFHLHLHVLAGRAMQWPPG